MIPELQNFLLASPRLLPFVPLLLGAYLLGRAAVRKSLFATAAESSSVRIAVGFAVLALLGFGLGVFRYLQPLPALVALAVVTLAAIWHRRDGSSALSSREAFGPGRWILLAAFLYFTIVLLRDSLYPPLEWDSLSYHLPVARDFLRHGLTEASPYLRYPVFPQAADVLFAWGLLAGGETPAVLFSLTSWVLIGVLLFAWGSRDDTPRAGLFAAFLWVGGQLALLLSTVAYVELPLTLFVTAASFCLWRWRSAPHPGDRQALLAVAAVLAGAAVATKYTGLWVLVPLAAAVWFWAGTQGRGRSLLLFLGVAVAVAAPWYVRSWLLSGDPLFPMLTEWIGNRFWSAEDYAKQTAELRSHGVGRGVGGFVQIWGELAWNQSRLHGVRVASLALVIPLPILAALRWREPRGRAIFALIAFLFLPFFFFAQTARYLLPVYPLLCLEVGSLVDRMFRRLRFPGTSVAGRIVSWSLAALLLIPGFQFFGRFPELRRPLPVSAEERSTYANDRLPGHRAVELLNQQFGRAYGLYALYDSRFAYACEGRFYGDWFGPARYDDFVAHTGDADSLANWLVDLGATHLLLVEVDRPEFFPMWEERRLPSGGRFAERFRVLMDRPRFALYVVEPNTPSLDDSAAEPR